MGPVFLLAVYLLPSGFVLLSMIRARSFSLHHISSLRREPKGITLEEWLAVYGYLGISLQTRNKPPRTKPRRHLRLIGSGVAFAASLILFLAILPTSVPLSFAHRDWNSLGVAQAVIAGVVLASSVVLAFRRPRQWRLIGHPEAEYPYAKWSDLETTTTNEDGNPG